MLHYRAKLEEGKGGGTMPGSTYIPEEKSVQETHFRTISFILLLTCSVTI